MKHDIEQFSPRTGRTIGEDGLLYNLVDLLANGGGQPRPPGITVVECLMIEATADDAVTIFQGTTVALANGSVFVFTANVVIGAGNLDAGEFAVGTDYYIYIGNSGAVVISANATPPAGQRNIAGFHFGVCRRDTAAPANIYNGIIPRSVWTLSHRPKCAPQGMLYLSGGVWADIYLASDDGAGGLASKYLGVPVTGTENLIWYAAVERLARVGKRPLSYTEWVQAAAGSPPGTTSGNQNAWTSSTERAPAGFVANAVSSIGCRDCVGNTWEWLSDIVASGIGTSPDWQDVMSGQGFGQMWINAPNDFRAVLAGGSYYNGAFAGSRSVCTIFSPWIGNPSIGVRGACVSL